MPVGRIVHTRNDQATLGQRGGHAELVVVAVQIIDVLRDRFALEVLPRTTADAVTRVDGGFSLGSLRAEIGVPSLAASAVSLRQFLTMPVGTFEAAKVSALARPCTGDKEGHIRRLW